MLNIILTLFISLLCLQPLHASNESTVITAAQYNHANEAKIKELESIITTQQGALKELNEKYSTLLNKLESDQNKESNFNFAIWVTILLGCVTIIITVLGVVVALISIFGYKKIKDSAQLIAEEKSKEIASQIAEDEVNKQLHGITITEIARLIDDGKLTPQIQSVVDMLLRNNSYKEGSSGFDIYPEFDAELNNE